MSDNKMTVYEQMNLDEKLRLSQALAKSQRFQGDRNAFEIFVKLQAGLELGIPPIQSLTQVHVVQGKVTLGAGVIAAKIKENQKYDFKIKEHTEDRCVLVFYESGQEIGESSFSMADAEKANLTGKQVWRMYPRNMLFARAISNGARWYTPDIFMGSVYTPEELGDGSPDKVEESSFQVGWTPDYDSFIKIAAGELGRSEEEVKEVLEERGMDEFTPEKAEEWKKSLFESLKDPS